ncbi:MAG: zinc ribbon domain-containing protein [Elusimicrobia bacterium]|nr:zinc ribbon domain-containing protein [Elusimicrobiota bacterium]
MVCPNCGAQQPDGAVECSSCAVIFAKWRARANAAFAPPVPSARAAPTDITEVLAASPEPRRGLGVFPLLAAAIGAAWLWLAYWPVPQASLVPDAPVKAGDAVVTYRNGQKCLLSDAKLDYTYSYAFRGYRVCSSRGHCASGSSLTKTADALRVASTSGGPLDLPLSRIGEIRFAGETDPGKPDQGRITGVELATREGRTHRLYCAESQAIVPDANFAWGESFQPQRVSLRGSPAENDCPASLNLTSAQHELGRTPLRIEFY